MKNVSKHGKPNSSFKSPNGNSDNSRVGARAKENNELSKDARIKRERERLLSKVASNSLKDIRSRVAFVLNHFPETRNSDIKLAFKYWHLFQADVIRGNGAITETEMYKLERQPSLTRARAKIQNDYGLFKAVEEVRAMRRGANFKQREQQVADKPGIPESTFYVDESGKTQQYVVVGGLCFVDPFRTFQLSTHMMRWAQNKKVTQEFHFTELTKHRLPLYQQFIKEALGFLDSVSLQAVVLSTKDLKNRSIEDIVCELHYWLVVKGIDHEVEKRRATLPREVNVFKDKEDGTDGLFMSKLQQELRSSFQKHYGGKLTLNILEAVDSKADPFIQLSDLYIGSISRILNRESGASRNHKDEFAEFLISSLGLSIDNFRSSFQDMAFVYFL